MLDLEIAAPDLARITAELDATPAQVVKALNSTLRKLATWLRAQSVKGLSAELKVKQKVIRRRLKQFRVKQTPDGSQVTVWYGLNPVALIYLGAKWKRGDAAVRADGGRKVASGFIVKGRGGGKQVFKRRGKARLPLVKQEAEVQKTAEPYIERSLLGGAEFEARFWKTFEHELNWAASR